MIRYLLALAWYRACLWWLILTGRGKKDAPDYLLDAYNAQADAWNRMQR